MRVRPAQGDCRGLRALAMIPGEKMRVIEIDRGPRRKVAHVPVVNRLTRRLACGAVETGIFRRAQRPFALAALGVSVRLHERTLKHALALRNNNRCPKGRKRLSQERFEHFERLPSMAVVAAILLEASSLLEE